MKTRRSNMKTLKTLKEVMESIEFANGKVQLPTHYYQWLVDQADKSADYEETLKRIGSKINQVLEQ